MIWEEAIAVCAIVFVADSIFGIGPSNKWLLETVRKKGFWPLLPLTYSLMWVVGAFAFVAGLIVFISTLIKLVDG